MSIRINNARNFAGQLYATQDWVNTQITESNESVLKTVGLLANNQVEFTEVGGETQTLDLSALVTSANKGIVVSNNQLTLTLNDTANGQTAKYLEINSTKGLTVKGIDEAIAAASTVLEEESGSPLTLNSATNANGGTTYTLGLSVDGTTIVNDNGTLASGLTLVKLATATSGFAASYQLQDGNGTAIGSTIDIVRDQYLKSAVFGWYTKSGSDYTVATKGTAGAIPCLKVEVWTNTDGADNNDAIATTIYIEVTDLFNPYTAGQGLALNGGEFSVAIDNTSEAVTTGASATTPVLSKSANGIKVTGIQNAIDYAIGVEDAAIKSAINAATPITLTEVQVTVPAGVTGSWSSSAINGRVIAVSDANGVIYPEIAYTNTNGVITTVLTADFGSTATAAAETWTCVVASPISLS